MFPTRYYADRYYAPRYFPKVGADPAPGTGGGNLLLLGAGCWLLWLIRG